MNQKVHLIRRINSSFILPHSSFASLRLPHHRRHSRRTNRRCRQQNRSSRSFTQTALQPHRPAAALDPPERFRQSHATPPARGFRAEERIECTPKRLFIHPAAIIRHHQRHPT